MQRQILDGVPYFVDTLHRVYLWDAEGPSFCVGSYDPATKQLKFHDNLLTSLEPRLQEWRATQQPRARKPGAAKTKRRGDSGGTGAEDENSGSDE